MAFGIAPWDPEGGGAIVERPAPPKTPITPWGAPPPDDRVVVLRIIHPETGQSMDLKMPMEVYQRGGPGVEALKALREAPGKPGQYWDPVAAQQGQTQALAMGFILTGEGVSPATAEDKAAAVDVSATFTFKHSDDTGYPGGEVAQRPPEDVDTSRQPPGVREALSPGVREALEAQMRNLGGGPANRPILTAGTTPGGITPKELDLGLDRADLSYEEKIQRTREQMQSQTTAKAQFYEGLVGKTDAARQAAVKDAAWSSDKYAQHFKPYSELSADSYKTSQRWIDLKNSYVADGYSEAAAEARVEHRRASDAYWVANPKKETGVSAWFHEQTKLGDITDWVHEQGLQEAVTIAAAVAAVVAAPWLISTYTGFEVPAVLSAASSAAVKAADAALAAGGKVLKGLAGAAKTLGAAGVEAVKAVIDTGGKVVGKAADIIESVGGTVGDIVGDVADTVLDTAKTVGEKLEDAWDLLPDKVKKTLISAGVMTIAGALTDDGDTKLTEAGEAGGLIGIAPEIGERLTEYLANPPDPMAGTDYTPPTFDKPTIDPLTGSTYEAGTLEKQTITPWEGKEYTPTALEAPTVADLKASTYTPGQIPTQEISPWGAPATETGAPGGTAAEMEAARAAMEAAAATGGPTAAPGGPTAGPTAEMDAARAAAAYAPGDITTPAVDPYAASTYTPEEIAAQAVDPYATSTYAPGDITAQAVGPYAKSTFRTVTPEQREKIDMDASAAGDNYWFKEINALSAQYPNQNDIPEDAVEAIRAESDRIKANYITNAENEITGRPIDRPSVDPYAASTYTPGGIATQAVDPLAASTFAPAGATETASAYAAPTSFTTKAIAGMPETTYDPATGQVTAKTSPTFDAAAFTSGLDDLAYIAEDYADVGTFESSEVSSLRESLTNQWTGLFESATTALTAREERQIQTLVENVTTDWGGQFQKGIASLVARGLSHPGESTTSDRAVSNWIRGRDQAIIQGIRDIQNTASDERLQLAMKGMETMTDLGKFDITTSLQQSELSLQGRGQDISVRGQDITAGESAADRDANLKMFGITSKMDLAKAKTAFEFEAMGMELDAALTNAGRLQDWALAQQSLGAQARSQDIQIADMVLRGDITAAQLQQNWAEIQSSQAFHAAESGAGRAQDWAKFQGSQALAARGQDIDLAEMAQRAGISEAQMGQAWAEFQGSQATAARGQDIDLAEMAQRAGISEAQMSQAWAEFQGSQATAARGQDISIAEMAQRAGITEAQMNQAWAEFQGTQALTARGQDIDLAEMAQRANITEAQMSQAWAEFQGSQALATRGQDIDLAAIAQRTNLSQAQMSQAWAEFQGSQALTARGQDISIAEMAQRAGITEAQMSQAWAEFQGNQALAVRGQNIDIAGLTQRGDITEAQMGQDWSKFGIQTQQDAEQFGVQTATTLRGQDVNASLALAIANMQKQSADTANLWDLGGNLLDWVLKDPEEKEP